MAFWPSTSPSPENNQVRSFLNSFCVERIVIFRGKSSMPILTIFSAKVPDPLFEPDPELESITNFNSEEVSVRCNSFIERNRIRTICSVTGVFKSFTFELLISLFQRYKHKMPQFQNLSQSRDPGTARSADRSVLIGSRISKFWWSWSGPRLEFYVGPVFDLSGPGASWSLHYLFFLEPGPNHSIRNQSVLVQGSLSQRCLSNLRVIVS